MKLPLFLAAAFLLAGATIPGVAAESDAAADYQVLEHDGLKRSYVVRVPPKLQHKAKVPLVLVLHGGGGNAKVAESMTGFTAKGANENFIVVYPEGTGRFKDKLLTWNARHCCGHAIQKQIDDVGFIRELIDRLGRDYPVDPERIYVTGMSNGGMMAHRIGIELSGKIAAIAPVVATLFGDEPQPARPVSAMMINGMLDQSVPYKGGPTGGRFPRAWDGTPAKPAMAQGAFWAAANRCTDAPPVKDERGPLIQWQYLCPAGKAVELYLLKDTGHAWPSGKKGSQLGDAPGSSMNATDVIWAFFKTRKK